MDPVTTPLRVLLVDDAPDVRQLVRLLLRSEPRFEVVGEAANGREAVALAGELRPDVVLLDLAMPVMDGLEALPLIREACPGVSVVMLSAHDPRTFAAAAEVLGAVGSIDKRIPSSDLAGEVLRLVDAT